MNRCLNPSVRAIVSTEKGLEIRSLRNGLESIVVSTATASTDRPPRTPTADLPSGPSVEDVIARKTSGPLSYGGTRPRYHHRSWCLGYRERVGIGHGLDKSETRPPRNPS